MDDKLKGLRRFSLFMTFQLSFLGLLLVSMGVLFSRDMNGNMTFSGIFFAVLAGLTWHAAYLSYDSSREMKNFTDLESYIKHLESQRKR